MEEKNKKLPSTRIQWYPGHMAKTKRQILGDLKLVDVIVEILDARIPISSQNPDIEKMLYEKKRIIVLNKSDLSDENENKKWKEFFTQKGFPTVIVDSNTGNGTREVLNNIQSIIKDELKKQEQKGRVEKNIRIMVVRHSKCW